ncbi:MAG: hypothetical protein VX430_04340 [Pseudomonadota bacterium]|nr:hypothetical protein [Pseudomonadota bacterium]
MKREEHFIIKSPMTMESTQYSLIGCVAIIQGRDIERLMRVTIGSRKV